MFTWMHEGKNWAMDTYVHPIPSTYLLIPIIVLSLLMFYFFITLRLLHFTFLKKSFLFSALTDAQSSPMARWEANKFNK